MTRTTIFALLLTSVTNWCLAAELTPAQAAAKAILQQGWGTTLAEKSLVDTQFAGASAKAPNDTILLTAHWMALARQNRYKESLDSLNAFLKIRADSLPALQTKVFVLTALKRHSEAMDAAGELARECMKKSLAEQADVMSFLGRYVGFLKGPLSNEVNQQQQEKFAEQLEKLFNEEQTYNYKKGKDAVAAKFEEFEKSTADKNLAAKAAADADSQNKLDFLNKEQDKIDDDAKKVEERDRKAAEELRLQLDLLNQRLTEVNREIDKLTRIRSSNISQQDQDRKDAVQARNKADREKDLNTRKRLIAEAERFEAAVQNAQFNIEDLDDQITKEQRLAAKLVEAVNLAKAGRLMQGQELDNLRRGLDKKEDKIEGRKNRIAQAKLAPKTITLPSHARAFSTYAVLPLDDWRSLILKKLP